MRPCTRLAIAPLALLLLSTSLAGAQGTAAPYTEGPVWAMSFIRTTYGFDDDYIKSLAGPYKKIMDEAKRQGLIVSYKIISAEPASADDWNMMLLIEYKNMAALDGLDNKMRAIEAHVVGNEDAQRNLMTKRHEIRKVIGSKLGREIILK